MAAPSPFELTSDLLKDLLGTKPKEDAAKVKAVVAAISPDTNNSKVKWKFGRPVFPRIVVKRRDKDIASQSAGASNHETLTELHCGCKCAECIDNYKSYWTEKTYADEIKRALDQELDIRKEILFEIQKLERDSKKKMQELELELGIANGKRQTVTDALELERQIRVEEVYRREVQNEELKAALATQAKLEARNMQLEREASEHRNLVMTLKEAATSALTMKDRALSKLREYEGVINTLERDNGEYRLRLHSSDVEAAKLKYKVDVLKQRVDSIRPHEIMPMSALVHGTKARGPLPATLAKSNNNSRQHQQHHQPPLPLPHAASSASASASASSAFTSVSKSLQRESLLQATSTGRTRLPLEGIEEQPSISAMSSITHFQW